MKSVEKFDLFDEVVIDGVDGIYTVEAYFEQLYIGDGKQVFELWYTVRDKIYGGYYEANYNQVSSAAHKKKQIMNEMLDEYNDCLRLGIMFDDSRFKVKSKYVLNKMKYVV